MGGLQPQGLSSATLRNVLGIRFSTAGQMNDDELERQARSSRFAVFRAPDGSSVAEVDLGHAAGALPRLIEEARSAGAQRLWVHATAVDADLGFRQLGGYARLEAEHLTNRVDLARPPLHLVRRLQFACFAGVWGHHEPSEPHPTDTFVGLHEAGAWIGICELDPATGWIDGPGVITGLRTPDRYARLVRGAAALMQSSPVALETWGDSEETIEAYRQLGFTLLEYVPGWELIL